MRRVKLCAVNHLVPACVAAASRHDEQFFQFREGHRVMARLVSQHAVRDLCSHEKAPGTSSHLRFDEPEFEHALKAGRQAVFRGHAGSPSEGSSSSVIWLFLRSISMARKGKCVCKARSLIRTTATPCLPSPPCDALLMD